MEQLANDIDTRCLIIKLHKAIVALRSEIPHTADQSGELVSPYLDVCPIELESFSKLKINYCLKTASNQC